MVVAMMGKNFATMEMLAFARKPLNRHATPDGKHYLGSAAIHPWAVQMKQTAQKFPLHPFLLGVPHQPLPDLLVTKMR